MDPLQLSIIIPTTNDRDALFRVTLNNAVEAIRGLNAEILVINDSPGNMLDIPLEYVNVKVLNNPVKGVTLARNYGARMARGELLLFLDNDILISSQSVKHFINLHHSLPSACVNPNWVYPDDLYRKLDQSNLGHFLKKHNLTTMKGWYGDDKLWKDNELFAVKSVASFHLSISKNNFIKSGGYNTELAYGSEDHDFPHRLIAAGIKLYIDTRITVFHNEADRLNLDVRLSNVEFRTRARKLAVKLGYEELKINYSQPKKIAFSLIYLFRKPLILLLNSLPTTPFGYKLYNRLLTAAEGAAIFKGYNTDSK